MTDPTPEQCAWLAGLFEGEGCASLNMRNGCGPYPALAIQMCDYDVLEQVQVWFGGRLNGPYQNQTPRADGSLRKPQWKWAIWSSDDVLRIGTLIRPWLKSRRVERLDELLVVAKSRSGMPHPYERTEDHRAKMSSALVGRTLSEESKKKMSEAAKKRPGRKASDATKAKQSAARRAYWQRRKDQEGQPQ